MDLGKPYVPNLDPGAPSPTSGDCLADWVQVNQFTLPPEAIPLRRMHGIVAVILGQLRAGADWGAIAAEYLHGEEPATSLGQAEAEFLAQRGRTAGASLSPAD